MIDQSYPWYINDWLGSATRALMTPEQRGIYRDLLDVCWRDGSLPVDESSLQRIAAASDKEWRRSWPGVREKFAEREGRLWNPKVDAKRPSVEHAKAIRSASAEKASRARWRNTDGMRDACETLSSAHCATQSGRIAKTCGPPSPSPSPSPPAAKSAAGIAPPQPLSIAFDPATHFDRLYRCHLGAARRRDCLEEYLGIVGQRDDAACERIHTSAERYNAYWQATGRSPTGLLNWLRNGDWESEPPAVVQRTNGARSQFAEVLAAGGDEWTPEQLAEMKRIRGGSW